MRWWSILFVYTVHGRLCDLGASDVMFVVHSRFDIPSDGFDQIKGFIKSFLETLDLGRDTNQTRFGVLTFDNIIAPEYRIRIGAYGRISDAQVGVNHLTKTACGQWCTPDPEKSALQAMNDAVRLLDKENSGKRMKKIVIVRYGKPDETEAEALRSKMSYDPWLRIVEVVIHTGAPESGDPYYTYMQAYYQPYQRYLGRMRQLYPNMTIPELQQHYNMDHFMLPQDKIVEEGLITVKDFDILCTVNKPVCHYLFSCPPCSGSANGFSSDSTQEESKAQDQVVPGSETSDGHSNSVLPTKSEDYEYEITGDPPGLVINPNPAAKKQKKDSSFPEKENENHSSDFDLSQGSDVTDEDLVDGSANLSSEPANLEPSTMTLNNDEYAYEETISAGSSNSRKLTHKRRSKRSTGKLRRKRDDQYPAYRQDQCSCAESEAVEVSESSDDSSASGCGDSSSSVDSSSSHSSGGCGEGARPRGPPGTMPDDYQDPSGCSLSTGCSGSSNYQGWYQNQYMGAYSNYGASGYGSSYYPTYSNQYYPYAGSYSGYYNSYGPCNPGMDCSSHYNYGMSSESPSESGCGMSGGGCGSNVRGWYYPSDRTQMQEPDIQEQKDDTDKVTLPPLKPIDELPNPPPIPDKNANLVDSFNSFFKKDGDKKDSPVESASDDAAEVEQSLKEVLQTSPNVQQEYKLHGGKVQPETRPLPTDSKGLLGNLFNAFKPKPPQISDLLASIASAKSYNDYLHGKAPSKVATLPKRKTKTKTAPPAVTEAHTPTANDKQQSTRGKRTHTYHSIFKNKNKKPATVPSINNEELSFSTDEEESLLPLSKNTKDAQMILPPSVLSKRTSPELEAIKTRKELRGLGVNRHHRQRRSVFSNQMLPRRRPIAHGSRTFSLEISSQTVDCGPNPTDIVLYVDDSSAMNSAMTLEVKQFLSEISNKMEATKCQHTHLAILKNTQDGSVQIIRDLSTTEQSRTSARAPVDFLQFAICSLQDAKCALSLSNAIIMSTNLLTQDHTERTKIIVLLSARSEMQFRSIFYSLKESISYANENKVSIIPITTEESHFLKLFPLSASAADELSTELKVDSES